MCSSEAGERLFFPRPTISAEWKSDRFYGMCHTHYVERTDRPVNLLKAVLVWSIFSVLGLVSTAGMVFARQPADEGWTPGLVIKELMPIVDPQMAHVRQMFIGVDTQIRSAELVPTTKGGITRTRVAVLGDKANPASLTLVAHDPEYRVYQVFSRSRIVPEFVPTLSWAGAEHILLGTITLKGFTFESDPSFPLHFKLVQNKGYVYLCGRGTVTTPQGKNLSLGESQGIGDFVRNLQTQDQLGREAAAEALGWLARAENERDEAVPALVEALKDDAMEVRRNAAAALGRIGDPRAREGLQGIVEDPDEWVRQVVADAIKKLGARGSE